MRAGGDINLLELDQEGHPAEKSVKLDMKKYLKKKLKVALNNPS